MGNKLSFKVKSGAGIADFGGNIFFAVINYWLMYYLTDMVGLSAALAGSGLMVGKIWDAVIDPGIGYISDHTRTRWGKRKVFMVGGLLPLFFSIIALFTKVEIPKPIILTIYYTTLYCLVNTFYSFIYIPYYSLLAEFTDDYNERTSLQSFRNVFAILGNIFGSVLAQPIINMFPNQKTGFTWMAVIFGIVISITVLITASAVKEPKDMMAHENKASFGNMISSYVAVFKNIPYVLVLITMGLGFITLVITQTTLVYFFKYYLKLESMSSVGILTFALSCIIFIPVVHGLSKHYGKKAVWIGGLAVEGIGGLLFYFLAPLGLPFILVCMAIIGAGSCGTYVLLMSVVADCADYDYYKTGDRKDGVYMGFTTFWQGVGMAFGAASVGWVLGGLGYVAGDVQNSAVLGGIRALMGIVPAVLCMIAILFLSFYPLTEKKYTEIKEQIRLREESYAQKAQKPDLDTGKASTKE